MSLVARTYIHIYSWHESIFQSLDKYYFATRTIYHIHLPPSIMVHTFLAGPPDQPIIFGVQDILVNNEFSIFCQANNGIPTPKFQWFVGKRNLTAFSSLNVSTDGSQVIATSELRYTPIKEDDGLVLVCDVSHPTLTQSLTATSPVLRLNCEYHTTCKLCVTLLNSLLLHLILYRGETHITKGVPDGNHQTQVYDMEDHPLGHGDVTSASADLYKFVFYFVKPNTQNHVWVEHLPPIGSPLTQSVG